MNILDSPFVLVVQAHLDGKYFLIKILIVHLLINIIIIRTILLKLL